MSHLVRFIRKLGTTLVILFVLVPDRVYARDDVYEIAVPFHRTCLSTLDYFLQAEAIPNGILYRKIKVVESLGDPYDFVGVVVVSSQTEPTTKLFELVAKLRSICRLNSKIEISRANPNFAAEFEAAILHVQRKWGRPPVTLINQETVTFLFSVAQ